MNHPDLKQ
jgi:hypothetical protein